MNNIYSIFCFVLEIMQESNLCRDASSEGIRRLIFTRLFGSEPLGQEFGRHKQAEVFSSLCPRLLAHLLRSLPIVVLSCLSV